MNKITTIGLDIAKDVFHLVACDRNGKVIQRKKLNRSTLLTYFSSLPPCLIGIEACQSSHHWARELSQLGHDARLIPAQKVKPFLQGNKTDYNDALAICEAVVRPTMRFVPIKSVEQQDQKLLSDRKEWLTHQRTSQANQMRSLLTERGCFFAKGYASLRSQVEQILAENPQGFSETFIHTLSVSYSLFKQLSESIAEYEAMIKQRVKQDDRCRKLLKIGGFGPIVAYAFSCYVGDGTGYAKGRDVSASVGIVPRQHSTGDRPQLLGISKRGNKHLRYLLIHGARAAINHAEGKPDPLSQWMVRLVKRVGKNKATVAYANKMARIGWAMIRYGTDFDPKQAALMLESA